MSTYTDYEWLLMNDSHGLGDGSSGPEYWSPACYVQNWPMMNDFDELWFEFEWWNMMQ